LWRRLWIFLCTEEGTFLFYDIFEFSSRRAMVMSMSMSSTSFITCYGWARQKLPRRWSRPPKTELWADFRVQTVEIGVFWRFGTVAVASFVNVATMGAVRRRIHQIRQPHPPISENIHVV